MAGGGCHVLKQLWLFGEIERLSKQRFIVALKSPTAEECKVKLATIVEGDPKAPFSIATTPKCREGCYSFSRISPLYL